MIVMKFGGTSTKDAAAVSNVVSIVRNHASHQPIIVISAIAQATNMLEQAGRLASEGKTGEARDRLLQLIDRHYTIVDTLVKERERHRRLRSVIAASLADLEEIIRGVAILRELTPRTLDTVYSYGELLSSRIVSAALQESGIDSEWLDTAGFMITDDGFNHARPMMEIVVPKLAELLAPCRERGAVPVTQGFIGCTRSGRRTTMGRESSDYSAAVIGAAIDAENIQIWTDVDGVLTADPRIVESPLKLKELEFSEAFELSYFGAKVLHPDTMLPAIEKNIPIQIRNSYRPGGSGTLVSPGAELKPQLVKSVAQKRNVTVLTVRPRTRYSPFLFWEHVSSILTRHGAVPVATATSEYNYACVIDNSADIRSLLHDLEGIGHPRSETGRGVVCLVGAGLRGAQDVIRRAFGAIGSEAVSLISFGSSDSSLVFVIADEAVPDAVRNIHREFFEPPPDGGIFEAPGE